MLMSGAEILLKSLQDQGVEVIFGYPGGVILPFYDKLRDYPIRHVLVRHEQNAAFAAQGYARSTGRTGVCVSTSGPGATNLVTGLTDAYLDSIPVVAITGQVSTAVMGSSAFQEADTVGIMRSCTKHSTQVKDAGDLPGVLREAFYLAGTGRPGPVLVDVPKDILLSKVPFSSAKDMNLPGYRIPSHVRSEEVKQAVSWIWEAKQPVIYAGGGIVHANAFKLLREFAEITEIPVALTLMALGAMPGEHPLLLGMLGMHGRYATNTAVNRSDLLIALGARFDDRVTGNLQKFARGARIIHVDIDPSEFNKNVSADLAIHGDVGLVLKAVNGRLRETLDKGGTVNKTARRKWLSQIFQWQSDCPLGYESSRLEIKPQFLVEELNRFTGGKMMVSVDVGQHQMWAAQYLHFNEPRLWLCSGGLGSMGFGLPAALGASVAHPDKTSVALIGDGGFQMSLPELGTLATYGLPVKVIIMNNQYLGMVRQWQELFYEGNYSQVEFPVFPDCKSLAASYGIPGEVVEDPAKLFPALERAFKTSGPFLLDVRVSREENVYPIIPAGAGLDEMLLGRSPKSKSKAPLAPFPSIPRQAGSGALPGKVFS